MSEALVPTVARGEIASPGAAVALPAVIVDAGPAAVERFLEFFAAAVANARTRAAYARVAGQFLAWCAARGLALRQIAPLHVAAYIRTHPGSVPTVKQHLAAIRALGDWLVVHQVLPVNPAASVRGPKHVVTKGATPVLTAAEMRSLLDRIDPGPLVGLRDRALLSVLVYSFARVSAAVGMRRQDYFRQGLRGWLRLHEKGGKRHDVPAHHRAEQAVAAYVNVAGLDDPKAPLFQSVDRAGRLSGRPLGRRAVLAMIKRRAAAAGLPASTCCHTVSSHVELSESRHLSVVPVRPSSSSVEVPTTTRKAVGAVRNRVCAVLQAPVGALLASTGAAASTAAALARGSAFG